MRASSSKKHKSSLPLGGVKTFITNRECATNKADTSGARGAAAILGSDYSQALEPLTLSLAASGPLELLFTVPKSISVRITPR